MLFAVPYPDNDDGRVPKKDSDTSKKSDPIKICIGERTPTRVGSQVHKQCMTSPCPVPLSDCGVARGGL